MRKNENLKNMVLNYIKEYIQEKGYSPSMRDIGDAVGLRSSASVAYYLNWLKADGIVEWESGKARTLRIKEIGDGIHNN